MKSIARFITVFVFCFASMISLLEAREGPKNIVVNLTGTAEGVVQDIDGVENVCFAVDLVDLKTEKIIGEGTDCLALGSIVPIGDDGGFGINNTTFFDFPSGTVASLSRTSIQPVESGNGIFITGEVAEDDNILTDWGTGRFRNATGRTRLSGIVDMSEFGNNIISFNCIFVIEID